MTNNPNYTHKIFSSRVKVPATEFVGDVGRIFYNEATGELRLSDGVTPHGLPIFGSSSTSLSLLQDVSLSNPSAGQSLVFNGSTWSNSNITGTTSTLETLLDVNVNSPTVGQALIFDGTNWSNTEITTLVRQALVIPANTTRIVDSIPVSAIPRKTIKWNVVVSTLTKTQSFELHALITDPTCKWTKIAILGNSTNFLINISITNSIAELTFENSEPSDMSVDFVRLST